MLFILLIAAVLGLDCSALHLEGLNKNFVLEYEYETPPTVGRKTRYFNPCGPVTPPSSGSAQCALDDHYCLISEIKDSNGNWVVSGIYPFGSPSNGASEYVEYSYDQSETIKSIRYEGAQWGEEFLSSRVDFICGDAEILVGVGSNDLNVITSAVCKQNIDKPSGWGFFHWIFFLLFLAMLAYALLIVYANSARTPFARDIQHNIASYASGIISDLPYLVRELWGRICNSFKTSRQGYSAL